MEFCGNFNQSIFVIELFIGQHLVVVFLVCLRMIHLIHRSFIHRLPDIIFNWIVLISSVDTFQCTNMIKTNSLFLSTYKSIANLYDRYLIAQNQFNWLNTEPETFVVFFHIEINNNIKISRLKFWIWIVNSSDISTKFYISFATFVGIWNLPFIRFLESFYVYNYLIFIYSMVRFLG